MIAHAGGVVVRYAFMAISQGEGRFISKWSTCHHVKEQQRMKYKGSCHCGQVVFEVEGELEQLTDCNCSICSRLGSLHWFVPREKLHLLTPEADLASYAFGEQTIQHRFCPTCGIHPFGEGVDPKGNRIAAINTRCLEEVDLSALPVNHYNGLAL
jgi:hypothetical protein